MVAMEGFISETMENKTEGSDKVLLLAQCSLEREWEGQVRFPPLSFRSPEAPSKVSKRHSHYCRVSVWGSEGIEERL
jgi:hypothetical protein